MRLAALFTLLLALLVAGCADGNEERSGYRGTESYHEVVIPWKGKNLYCVERGGDSHGQFSGLSCDWVAYHAGES